jgi:hypothetical protein
MFDGRSVVEWETKMSAYDKKTLKSDEIKVYFNQKNALSFLQQVFVQKTGVW